MNHHEDKSQKVNLDFEFVIPSDAVVAAARNFVSAKDENVRAVAKALLDLTAVASRVKDAMTQGGNVDLAPYFDFWFADAIAAANSIKSSDDKNIRHLAESLIAQESAIIRSKTAFLSEMKRRGIRPSGN